MSSPIYTSFPLLTHIFIAGRKLQVTWCTRTIFPPSPRADWLMRTGLIHSQLNMWGNDNLSILPSEKPWQQYYSIFSRHNLWNTPNVHAWNIVKEVCRPTGTLKKNTNHSCGLSYASLYVTGHRLRTFSRDSVTLLPHNTERPISAKNGVNSEEAGTA